MPERSARLDYLSANRLPLLGLATALEATLAVHPERILLYKSGEAPEFGFVEGYYQPDNKAVLPVGEQSDRPADPALLAAEVNEAVRILAESALDRTRRFNALLAETRPDYGLDGQVILPAYLHATWRNIFFNEPDPSALAIQGNIELAEVYGIGQTDLTQNYEVCYTKDGVSYLWTLILQDGYPTYVNRSVLPTHDALKEQCDELFGARSYVARLLAGNFETEDELDSTLGTILQATAGIYPKEMLQDFLMAVRDRAIGKQHAKQMRRITDASLPSLQNIEELTAYFGLMEN